jgi:hypothetical protein
MTPRNPAKDLLSGAVNEFVLGTAEAGDFCRRPSDLSGPFQREMRQGETAWANSVAFVRTNRRHWWTDWSGATKCDLTWDAPHTPDPSTGLVTDRPGSWEATFALDRGSVAVTGMRLRWTDPGGRRDAYYPVPPDDRFPADAGGFNDIRRTACLPTLGFERSSDPAEILAGIDKEGVDDGPPSLTLSRADARPRRLACSGCGTAVPDDPAFLERWALAPHYADGALCLGEVVELTDDPAVPRVPTPAGYARWD